jgi:transcription elongation factor GreA
MRKLPAIKQLEQKVKELERELRVEVPKELQRAAAHGDLRENAEYAAAKERQSYLQSRIAQLHARVTSLSSIKLDTLPRDRVAFGAKVTLSDLDSGKEAVYELVTPEEVDPREGKISVSSPIGKSLLGKAEGDDVVISLPSGVKEYEVINVVTLHDMIEE